MDVLVGTLGADNAAAFFPVLELSLITDNSSGGEDSFTLLVISSNTMVPIFSTNSIIFSFSGGDTVDKSLKLQEE